MFCTLCNEVVTEEDKEVSRKMLPSSGVFGITKPIAEETIRHKTCGCPLKTNWEICK